MYLAHYGLREPPFSITPDPRFVFLSERHRDALAHLTYGIGQGGGSGFVQLTGEVGTGKTTISRLLLEQLPDSTRVALILNPLLSPVELLEAIGEELQLDLEGRRGGVKALVDALNTYLLETHATGLRVVLIIDEAQNLSTAALEQIRLLTNLETPTQKLLQIVLLGQPELREQLARPELRQLAQRITARYHLDPLDADESEAYLRHRWAVAGGAQFPFTRSAARRLHAHAGGVPRLLNVIAERALLAGYARGEMPIGDRLLDQAAAEVLAPKPQSTRLPFILGAAALLMLVFLALRGWIPGYVGMSDHFEKPVHLGKAPHSAPARSIADNVAGRQPALAEPAARPATAPQPVPALLDADAFAHRLSASDSDPRSAWSRLLALWPVRADEVGSASASACPVAIAPGLFCVTGKARLSELAQFDRPALLKLRTSDRAVWAVLVGLGSTQALLELDGGLIRVHRGALEDVLVGYATIWRGPRSLSLPLKHGDSGPGVDWLRDRLLPVQRSPTITQAQSPAERAPPASYDAALVAAVRGVQRDFGLHSDGVVGPETLLALMAADRSGPHLRRMAEQ